MSTARTNLGPLTTAFVAPSSCSTAVLACSTCRDGWLAQSCGDNGNNAQGVQDGPDCWPPRRDDTTFTTDVAFNGWGFYSPGLSCPVGYSTACSATGGVDGGFIFQYSLLESETAFGCCPTGYTCRYLVGTDIAQTCLSTASSGALAIMSCSSGRNVPSPALTLPATVTGATNSAVTVQTILMHAPLIQLNVRETDVPRTKSDATTGQTGSATAPRQSGSATATPAPVPDQGLSTGGIVGISIATAGAVVFLAIAAFWLWRKKKRAATRPSYDDGVAMPLYVPARHTSYVTELDGGGKPIHEAPAHEPQGMSEGRFRSELPG